jgi:hypothetical protein
MQKLLSNKERDKQVFKKPQKRHVLDEPAMAPAITHLMHIANVLQHKAQCSQYEEGLSLQLRMHAWTFWVTTGHMPAYQQSDENFPAGGRGIVDLGNVSATGGSPYGHGLHRQGSPFTITPYNPDVISRQYVFDLLSGNAPGTYRDWLAKSARTPLLGKPIRRWQDYAPDLWQIFRSEFHPDPGNQATFRFIVLTAEAITGEAPGFYAVRSEDGEPLGYQAVRSELLQGRWRGKT